MHGPHVLSTDAAARASVHGTQPCCVQRGADGAQSLCAAQLLLAETQTVSQRKPGKQSREERHVAPSAPLFVASLSSITSACVNARL
jgi:hypothetical protein